MTIGQLLIALCLVLTVSGSFVRPSFDYGFALRFNGNQFVDFPPTQIGAPLSIELQIRPTAATAGTILEFGGNGNTNFKLTLTPTLAVSFISKKNDGSSTTVTSTASLAVDQYAYVVVTVDESGNCTIITEVPNNNGVTVSAKSGTVSPPLFCARPKGTLGCGVDKTNCIRADISSLILWRRSLDTTSERNRFKALSGFETALVALWDFEEGFGLSTKDLSGSRLVGSLGGGNLAKAPTWITFGYVPTAVCKVWGDPQAITLDNKVLTVTDSGLYNFAVSNDNSINIQLQIDTKPNRPDSSSIVGVALKVANDTIIFDLDFLNKRDSKVFVNGQAVGFNFVLPTSGVIVTRRDQRDQKHFYDVIVPFVYHLRIRAIPQAFLNNVRLRVPRFTRYVNAMAASGICGNFNGAKNDDVVPAVLNGDGLFTGVLPRTFVTPISSIACNVNSLTQPLKGLAIAACGAVDPAFSSACLQDTCATGDISAAEFYADLTFQNCIESSADNATIVCPRTCPGLCSLQGTCDTNTGVCTCSLGFTGRDCSQKTSFSCYNANWPTGSTTLTPFSGTSSVATHYGLNTFAFGSSNTGLEVADAAVFYLYQQNGLARGSTPAPATLSLVAINDQAWSGTSGLSSLNFKYTGPSANALTIPVKNSPSDSYTQTADGTISAGWNWWQCCTAGLAISNLPNSGAFCMNMNYTASRGISQSFLLEPNQFGAGDLQSMPLVAKTQSFQICGATCTNQCGQHPNCSSCTADPTCGWCVSTDSCEAGTAFGPTSGRCSSWRFSNKPEVSRVFSNDADFPVDPSAMDIYLAPNQGLPVSFFVNFPPPETVPLQMQLLVDLSISASPTLGFIQSLIAPLYQRIKSVHPVSSLGVSSFTDKPLLPFGSPSRDWVYQNHVPFTTNTNTLQQVASRLVPGFGGDSANAQLEALLVSAVGPNNGWIPGQRHIAVMITLTPFHLDTDAPNLPVNNGDGIEAGTPPGVNERYPSITQLRTALLTTNIIPVFIVPERLVLSYFDLVQRLGFGFVGTFTPSNKNSFFCQIVEALDITNGYATAQILQPGVMTASVVTPAAGYFGISQNSRAVFTAQFPAVPTGSNLPPTVIVVPGYGSITVQPKPNDAPVAGPCPTATIDLNIDSSAVLQFSGTSAYPEPITILVTPPAASLGTLFQFIGGSQGDAITGETAISDPLGRVIFVPISAGGVSTVSVSFRVVDDCGTTTAVQSCPLTVVSNIRPTCTPAPVLVNMTQDGTVTVVLGGSSPAGTVVPFVTQLPNRGQLTDAQGLPIVRRVPINNPNVPLPARITVTYKPIPGTAGQAEQGFLYTTFAYKVQDPHGLESDDFFVNVVVTPPTQVKPVALPFTVSVLQGGSVNLVLRAQDPLGRTPVGFVLNTVPAQGALKGCELCPALTAGSNLVVNNIIYAANTQFFGNTSFTYSVKVNDPTFGVLTSLPVTVTISVQHVNSQPSIAPLTLSVPENKNTTLLIFASDPDNSDILTLTLCGFTGQGSVLQKNGAPLPIGGVITDVQFAINYTAPLLTSLPAPDPIAVVSVRAVDNFGGDSGCIAAYTLSLTVGNHAPTASGGSSSVTQGVSTAVTFFGSDIDGGAPFTFIICSLPSANSQIFNGNNQITFLGAVVSSFTTVNSFLTSASVNFKSSIVGTDTFGYKVVDSSSAESPCTFVTVSVQTSPDPATMLAPTPSSLVVDENQELTFILNAQDTFSRTLTFKVTSVPTKGKLFQVDTNGVATTVVTAGQFVTNAQNKLIFRPEPNTFGTSYTTFAVSVFNTVSFSNPTIFSVDVNKVNVPPVANNIALTGNQRTNFTVTLVATDADILSPLLIKYQLVSLPAQGTLFSCSQHCDIAVTTNTDLVSASLVYVPNSLFFGTDSFLYKALDTDNAPSNNANVSFTVNFVNIIPVTTGPSAVSLTDRAGDSVVIAISGTDTDNLPSPLISIVTRLPTFGALFHSTAGVAGAQITTTPTTVPTAQVIYTPNGIQNPSNVNPFVSIGYKVFDGLSNSNEANIDVTVTHVALPIAKNVEISGLEENLVTFLLAGSDPNNANSVLTYQFISLPNPNVGVITGAAVGVNVSSPSFSFVPAALVFGTFNAACQYVVFANGVASVPADINIVLTHVNHNPVAAMSNPVLPQFATSTFVLDGFDPDGDTLQAILTLSANTKGSVFQVNNDNSLGALIPAGSVKVLITNSQRKIAYRPLQTVSDFGFDYTQINYFLQDTSSANSTDILVPITIFPPPTAPIVDPSSFISVGDNDKPVTVQLLFTDINTPFTGEVATGEIKSLPAKGTLFVNDLSTPVSLSGSNRFFSPSQTFFFTTSVLYDFGAPYASFTWVATDGTLTTPLQTTVINVNERVLPPNPASSETFAQGIENGGDLTVVLDAVDPIGQGDGSSFLFVIKTLPAKGLLFDAVNFFNGPTLIPITSAPYTLRQSISAPSLSWPVVYRPIADQNTFGTADDTFTFTVGFTTLGEFVETPTPTTVSFKLTSVNSAPLLVLPGQGNSSTTALAGGFTWIGTSTNLFALNVGPITLDDDARPTDTVTMTVRVKSDPNNRVGQFLVAGQPAFANKTYTITNSRANIDALLNNGITLVPAPFTSGSGDCASCVVIEVFYDDLGNFGESGTARFNTTLTLGISINDANQPDTVVFPTWPASAGLVGFTSVMSMAVTGVYQTLKRRKLLPEDADPWENDEFFDATTNNPLTRVYSSQIPMNVHDDS